MWYSNIDFVSRIRNLSMAQAYVLLRLALYADEDGKGIYPTIGRLSYEGNIAPSTVVHALQALEREGIIYRIAPTERKCKRDKRYAPVEYGLNLHFKRGERAYWDAEGFHDGDGDDKHACTAEQSTRADNPQNPTQRNGVTVTISLSQE